MRIGKLGHRIRIESKSVTQDSDYGTESITWATYATVWAELQDTLPSKSEKQTTDIRVSTKPTRVRTRYMTGITSDMRIVLLDRSDAVMQIVSSIAELGVKEGLEFMVESYTTTGQA